MTRDSGDIGQIRLEGFTAGGKTVDDGVRKLVYTAETAPEQTVSDWGWDDLDEFTIRDREEAYWIGPVEREGIGYGYLSPVNRDITEVNQIIDDSEPSTLDQLADVDREWQYQIGTTVLPKELKTSIDRLIIEGMDAVIGNGAYAVAKTYSEDELGL